MKGMEAFAQYQCVQINYSTNPSLCNKTRVEEKHNRQHHGVKNLLTMMLFLLLRSTSNL